MHIAKAIINRIYILSNLNLLLYEIDLNSKFFIYIF